MKDRRHNSIQDSSTFVTAILIDSFAMRVVVEKLAERKKSGAMLLPVQSEWQPMISSFVETYVSGHTYISDNAGITTIPFDSFFMFTCIRKNKKEYRLTWAHSLS